MKNPFDFSGTSFASFDYTNAYGEVKTYLVLLGATYANAKKADLETLKNATFTEERHEVARKSLIASLEKNLDPKTQSNQSKGQQNAYQSLEKGFRLHLETGDINLLARKINVTQSEEQKAQSIANAESGEFKIRKKVNSRQATIDKNEVKKMLDLKERNMVQFKFKKGRFLEGRLSGDRITL